MAWIDDLPKFVAAREAWQKEFGPLLRARDEIKANNRRIVYSALSRGSYSQEEKDLVFKLTGIAV